MQIEDRQTMQWPKEKGQKDNNDLQNTTQKTIDWATRTPLISKGELRWTKRTIIYKILLDWATQTPLKTRVELRCSRRVSSFCSTSNSCHITLVARHKKPDVMGRKRQNRRTRRKKYNITVIFACFYLKH